MEEGVKVSTVQDTRELLYTTAQTIPEELSGHPSSATLGAGGVPSDRFSLDRPY